MFQIISPQKVQHSDGYIVQVADRYALEYLDKNYQARVEVDFGTNVGVYRDSLHILTMDGGAVQIDTVERETIFRRIISGIEAMGNKVEIC